jgi:CRISPR system Cascade subunit CasC
VVGGVARARVSSQCWKRQVRQELHKLGIRIGVRTKQIEKTIREACMALGADEEKSKKFGETFAKEIAEDTLFFFSGQEANAFADYAKSLDFDAAKFKVKDIAKIAKKTLSPAQDGLDIALFGRMVAKAADMNMEAASSFAHAISTHKASNEVEFFTALDDLQDEPGSAHMGSLEYNSATYYRYISLDLGQLYANIFGDDTCDADRLKDMQGAVEAFTKALYLAVPAARQTTQSGASFWDYAHILFRRGQRLQASFDAPVSAKGGGYLAPSIQALENFLRKKEQEAGSLFQKQGEIRFGAGIEKSGDVDKCSVDEILASLNDLLQKAKP